MANCGECFHYQMCGSVNIDAPCVSFKNKTDVVEVVRCKNCKCCEHSYPAKAIGEEALEGWYCNIFRQWRKPDDYCSYGERKDA